MAKLKAGGMGNAKFFTKEDFDGLSPEEMSRKFGNNSPPKRKKKEDKRSKSQTKNSHEEEEVVEL